jgi:hypothetical protein
MAAPTTSSSSTPLGWQRGRKREGERDRHEDVIAIDWPQEDAREGMAKEGWSKVKTNTRLLIKASDVTGRPRSRSDRGGGTNQSRYLGARWVWIW